MTYVHLFHVPIYPKHNKDHDIPRMSLKSELFALVYDAKHLK